MVTQNGSRHGWCEHVHLTLNNAVPCKLSLENLTKQLSPASVLSIGRIDGVALTALERECLAAIEMLLGPDPYAGVPSADPDDPFA